MGISSNLQIDVNSHIENAIKDGPDLMYRVSQANIELGKPIEIVSDLPARANSYIIMGYVRRWLDLQRETQRDLRIFAWSYTTDVEKCVQQCTVSMSHIHVTFLPTYLRKEI